MDVMNSTFETNSYRKDAQLLSARDAEYFIIVNHNVINFLLSIVGVMANIVNIVVFYKLGFDNTINISFFAMSVSDLCGLLAMIWLTIIVNPLVCYSPVSVITREMVHLSAGIPHICFVRITGWITVFVTAERCLCITFPLKIKQIITPRVTMITICFIFVSSMLSFLPEYQTSYIDWKFYPDRNRTKLGLAFTSDRKNVEGLVFVLFSILGFVCFGAVIVFTVVLIVQLKQKSGWRKQANVNKAESISIRDKKTVSMVVMTAIVLIVCYIPGIIICLAIFFVPEFSVLGSQFNLFYVSWSFAHTFEVFNSSVNIFLYYHMSTKYREMFEALCCKCATSQTND